MLTLRPDHLPSLPILLLKHYTSSPGDKEFIVIPSPDFADEFTQWEILGLPAESYSMILIMHSLESLKKHAAISSPSSLHVQVTGTLTEDVSYRHEHNRIIVGQYKYFLSNGSLLGNIRHLQMSVMLLFCDDLSRELGSVCFTVWHLKKQLFQAETAYNSETTDNGHIQHGELKGCIQG